MIEKLIFYFGEYRKKIGYTLGILNVLSGLSLIGTNQSANGYIQIFVGIVLMFDAWSMP